jgi:uncharacterized protein YqeY
MTLKAQISEDMKSTMKAGDKDRLKVLRLMLAAIQQIEVDKRIELDDSDVLGVLDKMVKQRRDSISQEWRPRGSRRHRTCRSRCIEDLSP